MSDGGGEVTLTVAELTTQVSNLTLKVSELEAEKEERERERATAKGDGAGMKVNGGASVGRSSKLSNSRREKESESGVEVEDAKGDTVNFFLYQGGDLRYFSSGKWRYLEKGKTKLKRSYKKDHAKQPTKFSPVMNVAHNKYLRDHWRSDDGRNYWEFYYPDRIEDWNGVVKGKPIGDVKRALEFEETKVTCVVCFVLR